MVRSQLNSLAATVAYADIFDYPLTEEELSRWYIKKKALPSSFLAKSKGIEYDGSYYFLQGRRRIVSQRKKRYAASRVKWNIARQVARWLYLVPTIQLVGVTGGLAMNNAAPNDDIDLFIVTSPHSIWISRVIAIGIVSILGRRRKPDETIVRDKVCLNMFMSQRALGIPQNQRDLFSAHEVLQMQPLWQRDNSYRVFLQKNKWASHFLPNAWKERSQSKDSIGLSHKQHVFFSLFYFLFYLLEFFAKYIQLWYMRPRRTTEVITPGVLRFHPRDARIWIKEALRHRLESQDIPLDKIFYRG